MERTPKYTNAPIIEAMISMDTILDRGASVGTLTPFWSAVQSDYPSKEFLKQFSGRIEFQDGVQHSTSERELGFCATNRDQTANVQARLDGFSFHRLQPYERWEPFSNEARRLWEIYRNAVRPNAITRIGVRYVNRFDFPDGSFGLGDYLRTVPNVSSELPQGLSGFFMQLKIPVVENHFEILINEAIVEPVRPGVRSVVLDIDLSRSTEIPDNHAEIWELIQLMHVVKNQTFEACITDQTRELIR
jgi:uncharacterized protein (TIGR04255 family)